MRSMKSVTKHFKQKKLPTLVVVAEFLSAKAAMKTISAVRAQQLIIMATMTTARNVYDASILEVLTVTSKARCLPCEY